MNILYLADPNSTHDLNWIRAFSRQHKCYLVARKLHHHNSHSDILEKKNIIYLGYINDFTTIRFWKNFKEVEKLKSWVNLRSISLIHIMYSEPNILWANFRMKLGVPILTTTRGTDILITIRNTLSSRSILNSIVSLLYKRAFLKSDYITATSTSQLNYLGKLGVANQSSELIRTGIDAQKINEAILTINSRPIEEKYILFPRKMSGVYNHELSLAAIELLPKSIVENYTFVFLDADSSNKEYVNKIEALLSKSLAKTMFLKNQPQNKLWNLINFASLVVMTNYSDGTPVTALETLYLKTPLLLSPIDYDVEIFKNIPRFQAFRPRDLAYEIQSIITHGHSYSLEDCKTIVLNMCLREREMLKIDIIYRAIKMDR